MSKKTINLHNQTLGISYYAGSDDQTVKLTGSWTADTYNKDSKHKNQKAYKDFTVEWQIRPIGGAEGEFNTASSTTVSSPSNVYLTYDLPTNCIAVRVKITINTLVDTSKCKKGGALYFPPTGGFGVKPRVSAPTNPSQLDFKPGETNRTVFIAKVENYTDTSGGNAEQIEFEFVDENGAKQGPNKLANSVNGLASVEFTGSPGHEYRYRVKANPRPNTPFRESTWSNYTSPKKTRPGPVSGVPTLTPQTRTTDSFPVLVQWNAAVGAETYHIEWTKNTKWFDTNDEQVQDKDTENSSTKIIVSDGLDTGGGAGTWYFRVRGVNSEGDGDWSGNGKEYGVISIGAPPAAPTTWSYETSLKIGDDAHLCWSHNSEDGSSMTSARFAYKIVNADDTPAESAFDRLLPKNLINQFLDDLNIDSFDEITQSGSVTVEGRTYVYVVETTKTTVALTMDQQIYKVEYYGDAGDLIVTRPDEPVITLKFPAADPSGLTSHMPAAYIKYCNRVAGDERWPESLTGYDPSDFPSADSIETLTDGIDQGTVSGWYVPVLISTNPRVTLFVGGRKDGAGTVEIPMTYISYYEQRSDNQTYNYNMDIRHYIGSRSEYTDKLTDTVYVIWFDEGFDQSATNKNATRLYITPSRGQGSVYYVKRFIRNAPYFNAQSMELLYPGSETPILLTPSSEYMVYEIPIEQPEDPTKVIKTHTYIFPTDVLLDSQKVYWKVATKGVVSEGGPEDDGYGEYSADRYFIAYNPPSVSVLVEDGDDYDPPSGDVNTQVITSFPITITANGEPVSQTPIGFGFQVIAGADYDVSDEDGTEIHVTNGQIVFERYYPTAYHKVALELGAGSIFLQNITLYKIRVTYTTTIGLTAETETNVLTYFTPPEYAPSAEISIDDENLVAFIRPFSLGPDDEEILNTSYYSVYRREVTGEMVEIARHLDGALNTTVTDIHPALDYARYRIVAIDKTSGAVTFDDIGGIAIGEKGAVIHWDEAWQRADEGAPDIDYTYETESRLAGGSILKLPYNIDVSDEMSKDASMVAYAGRTYPVSYYGSQRSLTSTWSTEVPKTDLGTMHAIRRLAMYGGDSYVREPNGTGYWAVLTLSYSITHNKSTIPVTIKITRVEEHRDSEIDEESSAIRFYPLLDAEPVVAPAIEEDYING